MQKYELSFLPVKVISNFVCSGLLIYLFIDFNKVRPLPPDMVTLNAEFHHYYLNRFDLLMEPF